MVGSLDFTQILHQVKARPWGRPNGQDLRFYVAKICLNLSSCGASMVEMSGGRRRAERRERDVGSGES